MATGQRIKHYRLKAGWTLADLSQASGVDVGTISALEIRDSKRSQFFSAIAQAFGLTVEQLGDDKHDYEIRVADLKTLGTLQLSPLIPTQIRVIKGHIVEGLKAQEPAPFWNAHDELTMEAIKIMQLLDKQQKFAMLAKMREFKQHLDPPRVGQAL
jgi:transcriptional regulator with XRE-family HTH domain